LLREGEDRKQSQSKKAIPVFKKAEVRKNRFPEVEVDDPEVKLQANMFLTVFV